MVNCTFTSSHPSLRGAAFCTMQCNEGNSRRDHCCLSKFGAFFPLHNFSSNLPRTACRADKHHASSNESCYITFPCLYCPFSWSQDRIRKIEQVISVHISFRFWPSTRHPELGSSVLQIAEQWTLLNAGLTFLFFLLWFW